jgi:transposase InsO family protein
VWVHELLNSYVTDPRAQQLLAQLAINNPDANGYSLDKGLIICKDRLWVAQNSALQTKIINSFHASAIGGHSGVQATYHRIHRLFHWKGLKQAVEDFVKQCQICQQAKHLHTHPARLLQPLPIPAGAWQDLSMDFIEGLPKSEGYDVILVTVDRFTKYAHFIPVKHPFTAPTIARAVFDNVIKLRGVPKTIVSDRDKIFTSLFWKELFRLLGTHLIFSSSYHPQTDGQTERVNQCLEMYLRCMVYDAPKKWKALLSQAEFWNNSSFHSRWVVLHFMPYTVMIQVLGQFQWRRVSLQRWLLWFRT